MAVTYYSEQITLFTLIDTESLPREETVQLFDPYVGFSGSIRATYTNKAWDTVAGGWVLWITDFGDVDGRAYPGPGIFGIHTSLYRVEAIEFAELEE